MKVGDTIKIKNKELLKSINEGFSTIRGIDMQVERLAMRAKSIEACIWQTVWEKYPETRQMVLNFNGKTGTLTAMKMPESCTDD